MELTVANKDTLFGWGFRVEETHSYSSSITWEEVVEIAKEKGFEVALENGGASREFRIVKAPISTDKAMAILQDYNSAVKVMGWLYDNDLAEFEPTISELAQQYAAEGAEEDQKQFLKGFPV